MPDFDLHGWLDALRSGDVDRLLGFYAEDASVHETLLPEPVRGKAALRQAMGLLDVLQDAWRMELVGEPAMVQAGNQVAWVGVWRIAAERDVALPGGAVLEARGQRGEIAFSDVLALDDDGRILREEMTYDVPAVVDLLGLDERQMRALQRAFDPRMAAP